MVARVMLSHLSLAYEIVELRLVTCMIPGARSSFGIFWSDDSIASSLKGSYETDNLL